MSADRAVPGDPYPAVPHYHLPALHRLLDANGALVGAEVRDIADTLRAVFAPRRERVEAPQRQHTTA